MNKQKSECDIAYDQSCTLINGKFESMGVDILRKYHDAAWNSAIERAAKMVLTERLDHILTTREKIAAKIRNEKSHE